MGAESGLWRQERAGGDGSLVAFGQAKGKVIILAVPAPSRGSFWRGLRGWTRSSIPVELLGAKEGAQEPDCPHVPRLCPQAPGLDASGLRRPFKSRCGFALPGG